MSPVVQPSGSPLTGRQKECLLLLKGGLSSKQIARELNISPRTVDQHIAVALENLGVKNRLEAISRLHEIDRLDPSAAADVALPRVATGSVTEFSAPDRTNRSVELDSLTPASLPLLPPIGGSSNTASVRDRISWIVRLATFCSMLTCLVLLSILGLSEIVSSAAR
ncbi:helix-turn-helix domain-containing protein [Qipengyuania qiaonensis]|uniref:Helix-turn-helix transcriptional regulator n=1 Tax=Qipengyuania qiaonensis TaxID=2867240 RepID=A0ABS7J9P8_9SPHN|nr:helix-turn-helix transcriptional regulator [Qipengyuania qiaonensis]MBX7482794.1 helix-turn-helix transcriptional regulator [Qipengyuania qiaonensis]